MLTVTDDLIEPLLPEADPSQVTDEVLVAPATGATQRSPAPLAAEGRVAPPPEVDPTLPPLPPERLVPRIRPVPRSASVPAEPVVEGPTRKLGRPERPEGVKGPPERTVQAEKPPRSLRAVVAWVLCLLSVLGVGTLLGSELRRRRLQALKDDAAAALSLARRRGNLDDYRAAAARYRALLDKLPSQGQLLAENARLLAEMACEFAPADPNAELLQQAAAAVRLVQTDGTPDAQAAQAYQALAHADAEGARRLAQGLERLPAGPGLADYLAGRAAFLADDPDEAVAALRRAAAAAPDLPLYRLRLAQALRPDQAEAVLEEALQRAPGHAGSLIENAWLRGLRHADERERAQRLLLGLGAAPQPGRPVLGDGERGRALVGLAELALGATPPFLEEARRHLLAAQPLCPPGDVLLRERLAAALLRVHDAAGAAGEAQKVLALAPYRDAARRLLATALLRLDHGEEALAVLERMDRADRERPRGRVSSSGPPGPADLLLRAEALFVLDRTPEAQELAHKLTASPQSDTADRARLLLARTYLRQGELPLAQRTLDPLLSQPAAERLLEAQLLQAQLLLASRPPRRREAQAILETLVAHAPRLTGARLLLARLYKAQKQLAAAQGQLQAALAAQDDEEPAGARRELAEVLLLQGKISEARAHYDQLLRREADAELLQKAAAAYRQGGDVEGARRLQAEADKRLKNSREPSRRSP